MEKKTTAKKYFAAANGYCGFRSYFSEIFKADKYDRLYILKGGPGTGKSSFMKRLGATLLSDGCDVEEIYCSSDPSSLDGVIAKNGERSIAVIDGTAPHESDAAVPGACDELINLGIGWDSKWLSGERERIISIGREKKNAYKCAYSYLAIAGKANAIICDFKESLYNAEKAKSLIKSLADDLNNAKEGNVTVRLTSAFCKSGFVGFDTFEKLSKNSFYIFGDTYACKRFLKELYCELLSRKTELIYSPSVLDGSCVDSIFIPELETCFVIGEGEKRIGASLFFSDDPLSRERIKCAEKCHEIATNDAVRWFGIASELHFALEEIYSRAMDFNVIDNLYEKKLNEIRSILL